MMEAGHDWNGAACMHRARKTSETETAAAAAAAVAAAAA